jgi:hypothetical protein
MSIHDDSLFTLLDSAFFTPLERKRRGTEYSAVVAEVLPPPEWSLHSEGMWTHVHPHGWTGIRQGWKLHLSATPANGATVVQRVASVLKQDPAAFKFAADRTFLDLLLAKNWPRESGGKFITIYPASEEQFKRLGHVLTAATTDLDGPYILSDSRIPGSRIVFYRYGEHLPTDTLDARGHREHHLVDPSGKLVEDGRGAHYQLPEWEQDPFGSRSIRVLKSARKEGGKKVVLRDRFEIQGAIKYSNTGGIYRGRDLERDEPVVIRERRPLTGWIDGTTDAVGLLRKEADILRAMDGTGWTPRYVDFFPVWEHHYLVMEEVRAIPLRDFALSRYFGRRGMASPREVFRAFRHVILQLLDGIQAFHARGIILRDLTVFNVLVRPDRSPCFIDLEYAWDRNGDHVHAAGIHTPGYASPAQMRGDPPLEADDFYALGAIVVEMCSMLAPGLALNPPGVLRTAGMMMDEMGLPRALLTVAEGLLQADPAQRWTADDVRRTLAGVRVSDVPRAAGRVDPAILAVETPAGEALLARVEDACEAACAFFEASADPGSTRTLWPGSPEAHRINPVCIQYGACGPVEYMRRVRGSCPDAWLDWIERRAAPADTPPGLYVGLSGVALTLAACGRTESARALLLSAVESPLIETDAGLYHGAAGVGLAALELGTALDDDRLLGAAVRIGAEVERRARRRRRGIVWPGTDGVIPCGLAEGGSGVALFLTYLGACTGEVRYWEVAERALDVEFTQAKRMGGFDYWPNAAGRHARFRSPHVSFGSAGVGTAALRLYACTGDARMLGWAERCARSVTLRWTNKLWQDMGYAGWGETLLDMHAVTGDPAYRDHAARMAEILLATAVETRFGTAFPGGGLHRVAADFGMGMSGIGLFLHRLANPETNRAFFPDHLLPGWGEARGETAGVLVSAGMGW